MLQEGKKWERVSESGYRFTSKIQRETAPSNSNAEDNDTKQSLVMQ